MDKCLPKREFLQVLKMDTKDKNMYLKYDAEWLTILRLTNHLLSVSPKTNYMPGPYGSEKFDFTPTPEQIKETISIMGGCLDIPVDFCHTAPTYTNRGRLPRMNCVSMPEPILHPKTQLLCDKLNIDDPLALLMGRKRKGSSPRSIRRNTSLNSSEIDITLNSSSNTTIHSDLSDQEITSGWLVIIFIYTVPKSLYLLFSFFCILVFLIISFFLVHCIW